MVATARFALLLIDDDPSEAILVRRILDALTDQTYKLDHVKKCSQAITLLQDQHYDLVLLDNRLSSRMSAKFSVPIIKSSLGPAPLAVISNDVSPAYLQNTTTLGVDHIVDKSDMIEFLTAQLDDLLNAA